MLLGGVSRGCVRWLGVAIAALLVMALAGRAAAAEPAGAPAAASLWRDEWPEFSALEGFFTTGAVLGMVVFTLAGPTSEPRWTGGNAFDDPPRAALRLDSARARREAGVAGDVTYFMFPVVPVVIDSFIVSLLVRGDEKAALNLFLVSGEALAYTGLLSFVSNAAFARERPAVGACLAAQGGAEAGCDLSSRTESFFSGHTAMASASAGVVCANHSFLPLWGHPAADGVACGFASLTAVVTGVTRVMADRHYLSDVLVGSAVGFGVGFAVPTLLHYRAPFGSSVVVVRGDATGMNLAGAF